MPFLRKRPQGFGKQTERVHFQCWFPAFGDKTRSFNSDEIADIQQAEKIDQLRANFLCVNINLNAASGVAQIQEVALAHVAMRRDAARRTKSLAFFELLAHLRNRSAYLKTCAERLDAFRPKRIEFFAPQRDQFILFLHRWHIVGRLGRTPILFNWRFTERSGGDACDTERAGRRPSERERMSQTPYGDCAGSRS